MPHCRRLLLPRWLRLAHRRLLGRNLLRGRGISGSGRHLLTQTLHLGLGLLQQPFQRLAAAKGCSSGAGADAYAILSDTVQIDQPLLP